MTSPIKKILFVCMGNICRSPTAHAVMQHKVQLQALVESLQVDSAGTHAYHVGEQSDARSRQYAASQGVDMDYIRARKIAANDFDEFDLILAMDEHNLELIRAQAPSGANAHVELFLSAANRLNVTQRTQVPDPYYGGAEGFADVFQLVSIGCDAILAQYVSEST